jgi:hypothetical protein
VEIVNFVAMTMSGFVLIVLGAYELFRPRRIKPIKLSEKYKNFSFVVDEISNPLWKANKNISGVMLILFGICLVWMSGYAVGSSQLGIG